MAPRILQLLLALQVNHDVKQNTVTNTLKSYVGVN